MGDMKKNEPTKLFLNVETVPYRRPADANPFTYRETRPLRYRAVWVTRGTTCDLYKSKVCASQAEAVALARKWLDKQNEATNWTGPRYVDTTQQPERFGYSLNRTNLACAPRIRGHIAAMQDAISNLVTVETMPEYLKGSHRAAGNWGVYPHNGAVRERVTRDEAEEIVAADPDGYAHIVGAR